MVLNITFLVKDMTLVLVKQVVAGGGAVESALSVYLEHLATTLGSGEQLAIAEFADALLIIPKVCPFKSYFINKQCLLLMSYLFDDCHLILRCLQ